MLAMMLAGIWQHGQALRERRARQVAEKLHEQGLRVAAKFAARTMAYEIDLRWWILKGAAEDAELRRLIAALQDVDNVANEPSRSDLQAWIDRRFEDSRRTKATSWFVTDRGGRQLARHPLSVELIGKSFAFRDYFHGEGGDLPEGTSKPPIRNIYRSLVFESQATGHRAVAFTVPIWSGRPQQSDCMGVLGMTVELGAFGGLNLEPNSELTSFTHRRFAVLVDLRADGLEEPPRNGLIVQHPWHDQTRLGNEDKPAPKRLATSQVERLEQLRRALSRNDRAAEGLSLDRQYIDPVGGNYSGQWLAAFAPVFIEGRSARVRDTGWVVIVQER